MKFKFKQFRVFDVVKPLLTILLETIYWIV